MVHLPTGLSIITSLHNFSHKMTHLWHFAILRQIICWRFDKRHGWHYAKFSLTPETSDNLSIFELCYTISDSLTSYSVQNANCKTPQFFRHNIFHGDIYHTKSGSVLFIACLILCFLRPTIQTIVLYLKLLLAVSKIKNICNILIKYMQI